ncbi:hypothetical protein EAF00_005204 [Botryotinia globosa]|nr:hypothetical protein EAF00_005204 [Botryotinia globosa]
MILVHARGHLLRLGTRYRTQSSYFLAPYPSLASSHLQNSGPAQEKLKPRSLREKGKKKEKKKKKKEKKKKGVKSRSCLHFTSSPYLIVFYPTQPISQAH